MTIETLDELESVLFNRPFEIWDRSDSISVGASLWSELSHRLVRIRRHKGGWRVGVCGEISLERARLTEDDSDMEWMDECRCTATLSADAMLSLREWVLKRGPLKLELL